MFKCVIYALFCFLAVAAYVEAFDEIVSGAVAQYLALSQKIGGDVEKHVCCSSHTLFTVEYSNIHRFCPSYYL